MSPIRLSFLTAIVFVVTPAYSEDLREIYSRTEKSVLLLKTYDRFGQEHGQGTGFLISDNRIVTNHHVVEGANSVQAIASDSYKFAVLSLLVFDEKADLAILRATRSPLPPLELATTPATVGDRVIIVDNPLGLSKTLSEGLISAYRQDGVDGPDGKHHEGSPLIQITAPISPGSSGSPVMDTRGAVIAVAVAAYVGGQNLNFAVPVQGVSKLLATIRPESVVKTYSSPPERPSILRNVLVSVTVLIAVVIAFCLLGRGNTHPKQMARKGHSATVKNFRNKA